MKSYERNWFGFYGAAVDDNPCRLKLMNKRLHGVLPSAIGRTLKTVSGCERLSGTGHCVFTSWYVLKTEPAVERAFFTSLSTGKRCLMLRSARCSQVQRWEY